MEVSVIDEPSDIEQVPYREMEVSVELEGSVAVESGTRNAERQKLFVTSLAGAVDDHINEKDENGEVEEALPCLFDWGEVSYSSEGEGVVGSGPRSSKMHLLGHIPALAMLGHEPDLASSSNNETILGYLIDEAFLQSKERIDM